MIGHLITVGPSDIRRRGGEVTAAGTPRERLLEASRRRFAKSGFAGTRLVDVAEDVDLTTGSFYRHFGGKADLLTELFEEFVEDLTVSLAAAEDLADFGERWLLGHTRHLGTYRAAEQASREDAQLLDRRRRCRKTWSEAVVPHLPTGLDAQTERLASRLAVDMLDYHFFNVSRGWSDHDPATAARSLSDLFGSGLYIKGASGARPPRHSSRKLVGPSGPNPLNLMTWAPAEGRVDPTARPARTHWDSILEAATQVFAEVGYERSGIVEIAARAEVSPGTVYRYFSDKADIFRCLLAAVKSELYANALIRLDDDGRMMIEPEMIEYLRVRGKYAAVYRVWREVLDPGSEMEQAWVWIRRDFQLRIARVIRFGQSAGSIPAGYEPEITSELVVAASEGPAHTRFDLGWDRSVSAGALAKVVARVLGVGLSPGTDS